MNLVPDRRLGNAVFLLLMGTERWINRKVEHLRFINDASAKRKMSVDFQLPAEVVPMYLEDPVAPVALLKKQPPLEGFDMRDEDGRSLPVLTREQNTFVAWSTLVAAAEALVGGQVSAEILQVLWEAARSLGKKGADFRHALEASLSQQAQKLAREPAFDIVLADLTENFLLLAVLQERPRERRVLKLSYIEQLSARDLGFGDRARGFLGWRPSGYIFETPAVTDGSYHFELGSPEGLVIREAQLVATFGERKWRDAVPRDDSARSGTRELVHLYLSGVSRLALGRARVVLSPPRAGLTRRAFFSALGNTLLLAAGCVFFPQIEARVSGNSVDAGVAVLLVSSSAVSAYLARPGEHRLTSRMLFGIRLITFLSGIATYLAAITLIVGPGGSAGRWIWGGLGGFTGAASLILLKTLMAAQKIGLIGTDIEKE